MLQIVIPMAGLGSRFVKQGYLLPKPLIPVHGVPMIKVVIDNLRPKVPHRFIFVCQKEHIIEYGLIEKLGLWAPNSIIVKLDNITSGAACTVLEAKKYINNDNPLMIANSDQYINISIDKYLTNLIYDGLIMTMTANDPKWSYVGVDKNKKILKVVEKEVISNEATVGIYNFKKGKDFVWAAEAMIKNDLRVNNEFYVAPVYNQLINDNKIIEFYNIGKELNGMYGLGTPEDLNAFLQLPISLKVKNENN